ncbi:serine hydrolase [Pontimicrobium sp. SW4]|uniref:Serine hydrolase n=1 Tax=Pontimicrobium sp. SW4 TaxID=3153519 RepID=A0AAU7BNV4_9FLAO
MFSHKSILKKTFTYKWMFVSLLLISYTCQNNEPVLQGPQVAQFNLDLFEQNLIDYVNWGNDAPIGWTYAITKDGQLARTGAFGNAIQEPDGTVEAMTATKELNIASITKFYTAIVVMQLIEDLNLDVDDKIAPYLPNSWSQGSGIDQLTFANLMRHESGFETNNTDFNNTLSYDAIKQAVANGVTVPATRDYDNINFAIFRILIPSLQNNLPNAPLVSLESDQATQAGYKQYMQKALFDKCGLNNIDFTEEQPNPARYYNKNDGVNNVSGLTYGDWDHISGGGGYFMTIVEMAAVNAYYMHTDNLITEASKTLIEDNYFGLDAYFSGDSREEHGKYYGKNGSISNSGQGMLSQIQMFPINGIEIAVIVNSRGVTYKTGVDSFLRSSIKDAYNDAWED